MMLPRTLPFVGQPSNQTTSAATTATIRIRPRRPDEEFAGAFGAGSPCGGVDVGCASTLEERSDGARRCGVKSRAQPAVSTPHRLRARHPATEGTRSRSIPSLRERCPIRSRGIPAHPARWMRGDRCSNAAPTPPTTSIRNSGIRGPSGPPPIRISCSNSNASLPAPLREPYGVPWRALLVRERSRRGARAPHQPRNVPETSRPRVHARAVRVVSRSW